MQWWKSKAALLKWLKEDLDLKSEGRVRELHKINNSATERIEAMRAKVGVFVKWSLGMEGGLAALSEANAEAEGVGK